MEHTQHTDQAGTLGGGARRRRPLLASLTTLGVVTGLLGVAGVFAAGSDSATTGENDVISGELGYVDPTYDIQIATASMDYASGQFTCNEDWSDDLATGVVTSDGEATGPFDPATFANFEEGYLCLRNVGNQVVDIEASAFDLVDTETGCSSREAEVDATCGEGIGELGDHLATQFYLASPGADASNCGVFAGGTGSLRQLEASPVALTTLEPSEVQGICPDLLWDATDDSQTDQVSWRFRFDALEATTPPPPDPACPYGDDDAFEENDTLDTATGSLFVGDELDAVSCAGDPDFYVVADESDQPANFHLSHDPAAGDLDLVVLDGAGNELASSQGTTGEESIIIEPSQVFYVEVVYYDTGTSDATIPYSLSLEPVGATSD